MATTSFMVQLYTEQYLDSLVSTASSLEHEASSILDPSTTSVIREIPRDEVGGMLASPYSGRLTTGLPSKAFTDVRLVPPHGENYTCFYAPSFNPSPSVKGFVLAVLHVFELGSSVGSPGEIAVSRAIGAHMYVDQTD